MKRSSTDAAAPTAPGQAASPATRPSRSERARRTAYRGRFAILFVLLAGVAGAAVAATVVLAGRGGPAPAPPWSEWEPVGSGAQRAGQIADHVTDPYRLPSGTQLTTVTYSGPPSVTGPDGTSFQVRAIAVQPDTSGGAAAVDDVDTFDTTGTVMYTLCGLGRGCSIAEGEASQARSALLRREALELALYSFTHIDGVDSVLVLLPPRADGQATGAVFLERADVRTELSLPLDQTLTAPLAPGIGEIAPDELRAIERITRQRLYLYSLLQAQDGNPVMVLLPALTLSA